jgi:hypothetical protein
MKGPSTSRKDISEKKPKFNNFKKKKISTIGSNR